MITCPDCGQQAPDDTKFCDRCGRGLAASPTPAAMAPSRPVPLAPGTVLRGEYEIIELAGQNSIENRYRATRRSGGNEEKVTLRERVGPPPVAADEISENAQPAASADSPAVDPRAKTAELALPAERAKELSANGEAPMSPASAGAPAEPIRAEEPIPNAGDPIRTEERDQAGPQNEPAADAAPPPEESKDAARQAADASSEGAESVAAGEATQPLLAETPANQDGAGGHLASQLVAAQEQAFLEELPDHLNDDLGEVFGRVLALSMTLAHPAFERAATGFASDGRIYLVYHDSELTPLSKRPGGLKMSEPEAIATALQVCQAVGFLHRRALRLNDICPESVAIAGDGRVKMTGLDYVSNDNELQSEPIFNDGFTAPEVYRGRKADKRADVFSVGALLYTMLTGDRLESETWREESGPVVFYPPHVVSPPLEQAVRRALLFNPAERWPNIEALKAELLKLSGQFKDPLGGDDRRRDGAGAQRRRGALAGVFPRLAGRARPEFSLRDLRWDGRRGGGRDRRRNCGKFYPRLC